VLKFDIFYFTPLSSKTIIEWSTSRGENGTIAPTESIIYHFVISKKWLGGAVIRLKKNPKYSVDIATAHILQAELLVPTYFSLFARPALPRT